MVRKDVTNLVEICCPKKYSEKKKWMNIFGSIIRNAYCKFLSEKNGFIFFFLAYKAVP